ncbi:hypothetical protein [Micromonospora sp. LOL_024]|uniref:hypothetical protein n=1 Tax=Micromonospora sp. LOL_024 TaxID=3345412 RepID=UPI003A8A40CD
MWTVVEQPPWCGCGLTPQEGGGTHAALLASHPAPGRRHQVISGMPHQDASVVVAPDEAATLDAGLRSFVEALRKQLAQAYDL